MTLYGFRRAPILVALMVATVTVFALVSGCKSGGEASPEQGNMIVGTKANFDAEVLQSKVPVLLDFSATWCPPCRMLHPNLVTIATEYSGRAKVVAVDVDESGELAQKYSVRGIPALFVIVDGEQVDSVVGYRTEAQLRTLLDKYVK